MCPVRAGPTPDTNSTPLVDEDPEGAPLVDEDPEDVPHEDKDPNDPATYYIPSYANHVIAPERKRELFATIYRDPAYAEARLPIPLEDMRLDEAIEYLGRVSL
jgi:hypothetical protein